tara:strand:+ start:374 stop:652 length:279 start_codon:yes stop_codon:yes gene_type:complete
MTPHEKAVEKMMEPGAPVTYKIVNKSATGMQLKIRVISPNAMTVRCRPGQYMSVVLQKFGPNWAVTQTLYADGTPATISETVENFCLQVAAN